MSSNNPDTKKYNIGNTVLGIIVILACFFAFGSGLGNAVLGGIADVVEKSACEMGIGPQQLCNVAVGTSFFGSVTINQNQNASTAATTSPPQVNDEGPSPLILILSCLLIPIVVVGLSFLFYLRYLG